MAQVLTLELPDKTVKKLRALAMLSGLSVGDLETRLVSHFDELITENIGALLVELDGKLPEALMESTSGETTRVVSSVETSAPKEEEIPPTEHALSDDEDAGETKSLQEQVEEEGFPLQINVPNAGENADAFLDVAMSSAPQAQASPSRYKNPSKAFDPRSRQARVSEYTGDESAESVLI